MKEGQPKIVIFEGAQGSGKTSATRFLEERGYRVVRGIPTGEQLLTNKGIDNWKQSIEIFRKVSKDDSPLTMDRSLISLIAYGMRVKPPAAELIYRVGSAIFQRCAVGLDYCLIILNCTPQDSLSRENQSSIVAIGSLDNAQKEINIYKSLMQRLKADSFAVHLLNNSGLPKEDFFDAIDNILRRK